MKNHYQTLGVTANATQDEIKKSYRRLALKLHPDKNGGNSTLSIQFTEIQEAYQVLSDLQKRQTFDKFWAIYAEEQEEFIPVENENNSFIRDRSSLYIGIAALLILLAVIAYFYFSTISRRY